MKVILCKTIENLGKKDEIVNVSLGYAANFLIPKKMAKFANKTNLKELKIKQKEISIIKESKKEILKVILKKIPNKYRYEIFYDKKTSHFRKIITHKRIESDARKNLDKKENRILPKKIVVLKQKLNSDGNFKARVQFSKDIFKDIAINIVKVQSGKQKDSK